MSTIWTKESLIKLNEIEEFIALDSLKRAKMFIDYLIEKGESVSENPNIGRIVPEISNPDIREIIVKNYRIVYKQVEQDIVILTVFEGHRSLRIKELGLDCRNLRQKTG